MNNRFNFNYKLQKAVFIRRPNRFLVIAGLNGREIKAHLADPGRLRELLYPGADIWLTYSANPGRKTQFTVRFTRVNGVMVSLHSQLPNIWMDYSLRHGLLPELKDYEYLRREVAVGSHRFDFCLQNSHGRAYLEVKSVTLVRDGRALFPDAPTKRGASHVRHLADMQTKGIQTFVCFVIQRSDARIFSPYRERDPDFADALEIARRAGVVIMARTTVITPDSIRWGAVVAVEF